MDTTDIGHGRGWLRADAAASILRVDAVLGRPLDSNSAGRTREEQQEALDTLGPEVAAAIDDSWHVKGRAVDSDDAADIGIVAILNEHGWTIDTWEWWHLQYHPELDQHRNASATTTSTEENDMGLRIITGPYYRSAGQQVLHNGIVARSIDANTALSLRQGGVPSKDYDNEGSFETELREVWEMAKITNQSAAKAMVAEFGKTLAT